MEMTETMFGSGKDCWVCPNDRQLALRAKLRTGWSVHTFRSDRQKRSQTLSEPELEIILSVIRRAEKLEQTEQLRIGRLVERLDTVRNCAVGNGLSQCLLCGDSLGLLGSASVFCVDCGKKVCTKCGIETVCSQKRSQWKCKICSEQCEVWKRSGAWFYKALPKYLRPVKESSASHTPRGTQRGAMTTTRSTPINHTFTWAHSRVDSSDSESDQSEGSMEIKVSRPASKPRTNSESSGGLAVPSQTSRLSGSRSSFSDHSLQHPASLLLEDYDTDHSRGSTAGSTF